MDKPQKFLLAGTLSALGIFMLIQAFMSYGDTNFFWIALSTTLAGTMMVLVFNIYNSTKKLTPVRVKRHPDNSNKKH